MSHGVLGLDHAQVAAPAGCEAAARLFFCELLGLAELEKPEPLRARGGVWLALGDGRQLHVGVEDGFLPSLKAHPALRVRAEEIDALAERLATAGFDVRWDEALPVRRFYVGDPWGNRIELLAVGVSGGLCDT